jgi:hypothetical protein
MQRNRRSAALSLGNPLADRLATAFREKAKKRSKTWRLIRQPPHNNPKQL